MFQKRFGHYKKKGWLILLLLLASLFSFSQVPGEMKVLDSIPKVKDSIAPVAKKKPLNKYDSATLAHDPKKAAFRSAVLPGWGQIYNKKYWKLPIVYGVMGTCVGIFIYNLNNYRDTRFAYKVKYNMRVLHIDSALYSSIKPDLKPLSEESLRFYRNGYRRDIDYSALVFLIMWGLNVIDASVDAHMKTFDVGPDLSLQFKPGYSELAKTNGFSVVLRIGK